jgi:hypothetical protein
MNQTERTLFVQQERERAIEAARQARANLHRDLRFEPDEDSIAKWRREADAFTAECAEATRELRREEERNRRAMYAPGELDLQIEVLEQVATALETFDRRLARVERRRNAKTARPLSVPNFLGPR